MMAKKKILLPHNFSDYDHRALDFIINTFAHIEDVQVTIFNAYTPLPDIVGHVHEAPVLDKMKNSLNQLSQSIKQQEAALQEVKQTLLQNGFSEDQVVCVFKPRVKDTAGEIIEIARQEHFDLVVINHKPGKVTRFFTGSVYQKLVNSIKNAAICVVN